jgi:Fe-S-cluster-containing dehydrogenase component
MAEKRAVEAILVKPNECHGCLTCQLSCSLRVSGRFNPSKANIMINRSKDGYEYRQSFTDGCDGCGGNYLCVHSCPYGALILERN